MGRDEITEQEAESVRERLLNAALSAQEPKDRLWAVVVVLAVVLFALGGFLIEIRLYLAEGRGLSYERTATECLDIVVDNDRNFDLPGTCRSQQVVVHYPPEVCLDFFPNTPECGVRWEPIIEQLDSETES